MERADAVIIDLDGTLTSAEWRTPMVREGKKDWPAFFAAMGRDAPVEPLVRLTRLLAESVTILIVSGRPAEHEDTIRAWLERFDVPFDALVLRPEGDYRPDHVLKRELYERFIEPRFDVLFVIDDRPKVIEMWRDVGLYVLTAVDPRIDPLDDT